MVVAEAGALHPHSRSEQILRNISLEQMNPTTGALYENVEAGVARIEAAKQRGSKLIVLPELVNSGYCLSDLVEDEEFLEENKRMLHRYEQASKGAIVVTSFIDFDSTQTQEDGRIKKWNAAAVFCDGKLVQIVHKRLLPNYRYFDDERYFTAGTECTPIEVDLDGEKLKIGVAICEDIYDKHYPLKVVDELCKNGAELIVSVNASPTYPGKFDYRDEAIKGHIAQHRVPVVYCNTVGAADIGKTIVCFDGESLAYNAEGDLIAKGGKFIEESVTVDVLSREAIKVEPISREQHLFEAIVMGTRDYAKKSGFTHGIVPVSGGIDSALGLAIAVEAFGSKGVKAYNLPSRFNSDTTKGIAAQLAENFDVQYGIIPIQEIDDIIRSTFETHAHPIRQSVAKENLHARIRGLLMMLESNDTGGLLISCGNKTEIALGYSTLYGDMCGGISVIGDLSKEDVYKVSRYVNERFGREMIPNETFTIKPSAELAEGQYDPFDYTVVSPLVDEFVVERNTVRTLKRMFRERTLNFPPDAQGRTVYDKHTPETFDQLVDKTYRSFRHSVYKRLQGPPIPSVTERTFGFDLREPLINKWNGARVA